MPIDEPTFNIVDNTSNGRRIIEVPKEFSSGISVQGDETAEILFFSIDRYYDATDLWTPDMKFVIQWKTATKNGVTKAFVNRDSRAFIDDNGKLYFGWPISSEITEEAGEVTFSVRIFQFGQGNLDENNRPKLAFGLNTQVAKVKINPSIDFKILNQHEFEDAQVINKTSDIINRVVNSTIISEMSQEPAPTPTFVVNFVEDNLLEEAYSVKSIQVEKYSLATGLFDEEINNVGGYYNADHESVPGLNANNYRPGLYYTKEVEDQNFYEFDYEDITLNQVLATASSGMITYIGRSCATPEDSFGGKFEFQGGDDIVYKRVESETPQEDHKYYIKDEETGKFVVVNKNFGNVWIDEEDRFMNIDGRPLKYYERYSPKLVIDENDPVGCYWIVANNNEGKKAATKVDSYRIWIPGPEDLSEEIVLNNNNENVDYERVQISDLSAALEVEFQNIPRNNDIEYLWNDNEEGILKWDSNSERTLIRNLTYSEETNLALIDEIYEISIHSERNKKDSETEIKRKFRVTAPAQPFIFDTAIPEGASGEDGRKVIIQNYNEIGDAAYSFKIDFSENLEDGQLKMISDKVAYRFRKRRGSDFGAEHIFENDQNLTDFILVDSYEDIPNIEVLDDGYYYAEIINIVNEDFDLDDLNVKASAQGSEWYNQYENKGRVSRTPYYTFVD